MERRLTRLRGWIEASHPFPLAAVVLLTALVALASATDEGVDGGRLGLVLLGMLFSQLAVGWTNDYVDREADRRFQPTKPIAAGRLEATYVPLAVLAALAGVVAVGLILGPAPLLFLAIGTAAGLSYDIWLKQTHWSWAPFIVAFSVVPLYVWSALDLYRGGLVAIYIIALPLAPAAHIANVLPDIDADRASGRRNLALIWGRDLAVKIVAVCLLAPLLLTLLSLPTVDYHLPMLGTVVGFYVALLVVAAICYLRRLDRLAFQVIALASVLFAGGWLAAV
jgi:4-hydroxybenzoate polyprenyltransferase